MVQTHSTQILVKKTSVTASVKTVDIFHCGFDIHGLYLTTHSTHLVTVIWKEGKKEMFYLTMHSRHFIYGYMALDIW